MNKPKPPPQYAAKTEVPIEKSKLEIEKMLVQYGATGLIFAWKGGRQQIIFELHERRYRFDFMLAAPEDIPRTDRNGRPLNAGNTTRGGIQNAVEQANRSRWRELYLGIKAKLVMVQAGVTTLEEEFLAHVVLPNNETVAEWLEPQIQQVYRAGLMPALLPGIEQKRITN